MQIRKTIGVRLHEDELAALRSVAAREDRDVRRQAARLIRDGLIKAGELKTTSGHQPLSAVNVA